MTEGDGDMGRVARRMMTALAAPAIAAGLLIGAPVASAAQTPNLVAASAASITLTPSQRVAATQFGASAGALFTHPTSGAHSCSASVVHSSAGDLIVTAAHCVAGDGKGLVFAPSYANGVAPYGYWRTTGAYAASGWLTAQSEADDYVVLTVAPKKVDGRMTSIESVVGGSTLGDSAHPGQTVTAIGYVAGYGGSAKTCTTTLTGSTSLPELDCEGFAGGTSGSPWLVSNADGTSTLVGVLGGRHQGGCDTDTSYTSPVSGNLAALVQRAESGLAPDVLPQAADDGC